MDCQVRKSEGQEAERDFEGKPSWLVLLVAIGLGKRVMLLTFLCTLVVGALLAVLLPRKYTASVTLLPPQRNSSMSSLLASQLGGLAAIAGVGGGGSLLKNPNDMYVAMFRSRTVEDAMIHQFGLQNEYRDKLMSSARKDFERYSDVDGSNKDGLLHISVEDRNPVRAAELANGYVEQYKLLSQHLAITEAAQRRLFFQQQLEDVKNKLSNSEQSLKLEEEKSGLIQPESQTRVLIASAAELRAQIAAQEVVIEGMRTYAAENNAGLVEAQQQLDALKVQLTKLAGPGANTEEGMIVPRGKIPEAGLEYIRKYREVKYYETIFDIMARQFEMAKLDEAREGSVVQVIDPALPPDRESSPNVIWILGGSVFVGLFLGVLAAWIKVGLENLKKESAK